LVLIFLLVTGCAKHVRIMAPESMFEENRMQKIALLGEGGILWDMFGYNADIEKSRKDLEAALGATAEELADKGYDPAFSRPVRIVFGLEEGEFEAQKRLYNPRGSSWRVWNAQRNLGRDGKYTVYENYLKDVKNRRELPLGESAYEYPFEGEDAGLREAARRVLEKSGCLTGMETAPGACHEMEGYLSTIHNATGADTLCFVEVAGIQYTTGTKAVTGMIDFLVLLASILTLTSPGPGLYMDDLNSVIFTCMDAKTGELLWRYVSSSPKAASSPAGRSYIGGALRFLPDAGRPLEADCKIMSFPGERKSKGKKGPRKPEPVTGFATEPNDTTDAASALQKGCREVSPEVPIWKCGLHSFGNK
jgi:hypothetical protein